ncbi:zinc finger protein 831 isoform X1 [Gopherus evgoodei]|uniref:zinc finger protein 831 isoform X1 n=1 Tax=Gopherus evgoodei TaxID=1825980 RepID=UPI0011D00062|nr:zinc finger protein 831 isoform X1 [Gopherus evgoodei]XP_030389362.1 zinc finger protein 831 isoform X1 [Gopherus evgoodei]
MEAQRQPHSTVALADQPVKVSSLQAAQGSSSIRQSPVIFQQEHALPQTIYLKALTIPLYHPIQSGCYQSNNQLAAGGSSINLDSSNMPLILSPLLHSERIDQPQPVAQKQAGRTLTLNLVSSPVLPSSSCPNAPIGSPGKYKNARKYICKHCGRDCLKPSVLEKHIRSHTGERPFPCTTCGIAFKTQSNLYKHRRTQTHVNNTKLPSGSDNSGILEENEKATDSIMSHQGAKRDNNICEKGGAGTEQIISETNTTVDTKKFPSIISLPTLNALSLTSESQKITIDDSYWPEASQGTSEREPMQDPQNLSSPVVLPDSLHQRKMIQEQRFSTANKHIQLQRQQATYSDKQWNSKLSDYKLKKCESTDSGYLSRSDSIEQQMLTSSPLHSLCEQSTQLENETAFSGLRCTAGSNAKLDSAEKATALMLEKKKLEEHISKLISHNKAVVDDTQLDNVRPRKTVLSKQGSIDLPMPYTYKDSFHFDIRSLDVNRKKNLSLCSAKSTFTPIEKSKPLFFHSVPTQFSTTIDCVPVTRSNSLPFVESTRMAHDRVGSSKLPSLTRQPLNTSSSILLHSNNLAASSVDFPNSHPRALVRQTAVDDLPLSNAVYYYSPSEKMKETKKPGAGGEGVNAKCKKSTQRKLKMFSQEKWQMYGDETFKKIYQKMKNSQTAKKLNQRGEKATDNIGFTPDPKEAAGGGGVIQLKDGRSSLSGNLSSPLTIPTTELNPVESKTCPIGNNLLHGVSSKENAGRFTELMETAHSINAGEQSVISKTSPKHGCSNKHSSDKCTGGNNMLLAVSSHGMRLQLKQRASQLNSNLLNTDSLQMHNSQLEESCPGSESNTLVLDSENIFKSDGENHSNKETSQHAQMAVRAHNCISGESTQAFQKLPSERKKLKVDELKSGDNKALKSSPSPSSENNIVGETVKLIDCYSVHAVSPALVKQSAKEGKQNSSTDINESISSAEGMEYEKTMKLHIEPIYYSDNTVNLLPQSTKISKASLSEFLVPELKKDNCSSFALSKVTDTGAKTCPVTAGARVPLHSGDDAGISSTTQNLELGQVTPPLKKNAFSPKYILKLPQEESTTDLSLLVEPGQESMPGVSLPVPITKTSCTINRTVSADSSAVFLSPLQFELRHQARAVGLRWGVHTNWKALVPCSPVNSTTTNITTKIDDSFQNQSCRQKKIMKDTWKETEDKDNLSDRMQADEKWINTAVCSAQTTGKKVCFTSMYTGGFFISADIKGENQVLHHLHSGNNSLMMTSSSGKGATSSGDMEQKSMGWDTDGSSSGILKDTSPGSQDLQYSIHSMDNSNYFCHSFGTFYCHTLSTQRKELPALSQITLTCLSGNSRISSTKGSFPSLNAEPQLTWCCLTRSLPLPAEQKEKADSAYSSLHICKKKSGSEGTLSKCDFSFIKVKNISKTGPYGHTTGNLKTLVSSFSQGEQPQKQSSSKAGGSGASENISEREKKEILCRRKKFTTNKSKRSHKQKKMKINQKWSKGNHMHGYTQLKTNRLSKQHWLPNRTLESLKKHQLLHTDNSLNRCKKCHSPASNLQDNYLPQQEELSCPNSDKPASKGNNHKKEDRNQKNNSGIFSPAGHSISFTQQGKLDGKDVTRPVEKHSRGNLFIQNLNATPGLPMVTYSCSSPAKAAMQQTNNDLDICCLVTQPLIRQKSFPVEPPPNAHSDPVESSFWSFPFDLVGTGTCCQHVSMGSEVTAPFSLWPKADHKNILNLESQGQSFAALYPLVQTSGKEEHPMEGNSYSSLKEKLTPSSKTVCSALLGSKVNTLPETSITNTSLPSTANIQGINSSNNSPHGCMDKNGAYLQSDGHGRLNKTGTNTFKEPSFPFSPTESTASSETPSKTYKKRGLEMIRKQTRVEYDDTSSDDEDRLVIEI